MASDSLQSAEYALFLETLVQKGVEGIQAPMESSSKDSPPGNPTASLLAQFSPSGFSDITFGAPVYDSPAVIDLDVCKNVSATPPLISNFFCLPVKTVVDAHVDVAAPYTFNSAPLALLPSISAAALPGNFSDSDVSILHPYPDVVTNSIPEMNSLPAISFLNCTFADLPSKSAIAAHVDIAASIPLSDAFPAAVCAVIDVAIDAIIEDVLSGIEYHLPDYSADVTAVTLANLALNHDDPSADLAAVSAPIFDATAAAIADLAPSSLPMTPFTKEKSAFLSYFLAVKSSDLPVLPAAAAADLSAALVFSAHFQVSGVPLY